MEFQERLRFHRERAGLKQSELAKRLDMHRSVYHRLENNTEQPRLGTIQRICSALKITEAEFFADPDDGSRQRERTHAA